MMIKPISPNGEINIPLYTDGIGRQQEQIRSDIHRLTLPKEILDLGGHIFFSRLSYDTGYGVVVGAWVNHVPSNNALVIIPEDDLVLKLLYIDKLEYDGNPNLMMDPYAIFNEFRDYEAKEIPIKDGLTMSFVF